MPKFIIISVCFSLLSTLSYASFVGPPNDWTEWVEKKKEGYQKPFATPTVTHHIYLKSLGDAAYLDESYKYPRFVQKKCKKCQWKLTRISDDKVQLDGPKKYNKQFLINEKSQIPSNDKVFFSGMYYEKEKTMRLFLYDKGLKNLGKKRKRKFFPYSADQRVLASFQWLEKPKDVIIQRSDGTQKTYQAVAELSFTKNKKPTKLTVYNSGGDESYKDYNEAMLLFRDYTNGKKTYGAGRFLYTDFGKKIGDMKNKDQVTLDFNFSYNPPCAVSTGFHCPLPQDLVKSEVLAGEKYIK